MSLRHNGRAWQPGEGNPYGLPSRGNYDMAWRAAMCKQHRVHRLVVEGERVTVRHER